MESLREAFDRPFPAGRDWAVRAAARLGLDPTSEFPVRAITQGWLRLGTTADAELVDTLFVLTDERLGFGQLQSDGADPNWADLSMVTAVDLIEGVAFPLEAIEVQFNNGLAMFVGWTAEFVEVVIDVLNEHHARSASSGDAADGVTGAHDADGERANDASPDAGDDHADEAAPDAVTEPDPADEVAVADESPDSADSVASAEPFVLAEPFAPTEPFAPAESIASEAFSDPEPAAAFSVGPLVEDFTLGRLEGDDLAPTEVADRFFEVEPVEPTAPAPASAVSVNPLDGLLATPLTGAAGGGPWDEPGIVWPAPLDGVMFMGGHPVHSRRRKRATLLLVRGGLLCSSGTWKLHAPWSEVRRIDVQGADEVKFSHNQRIAPDGSALVVELQDRTHLVFEIRRFRPATLRSTLAVPLALINLPESMHIEDQRPPQAS